MAKPVKSGVRKMIYTMICKYEQRKVDANRKFVEKQRIFDEIMSSANLSNNEHIKGRVEELREMEKKELITSESNYLAYLSTLTEVSVNTMRRIKKEGALNQGLWNTPGKKRPRLPTVSNLDDFDISAIRNKINEFYCVKKQVPTIRTLLAELRESIGFSGSRETLRRILLKNGFEFKKNKNERSILIENFELSAWRHRFLRTIHQKRQEGKMIVYLDETYVHQNYKPKKSWQGPSTSGVIENISKGKRYIIVHAGSEKGFVPNALLVFSTKSKLADYHDDMNRNNFMKWLEEKLIPNLEEPAVIVMDNASYHVTQINKPPTMNTLKSDIQKWLTDNNVQFEEHFTKAELMCLVKDNKPIPLFEAEELLKHHGHEVLKLPPYHCDLNAIELIWSLAKRKVSSRNLGVPGAQMETLIKECFDSVTSADWQKCTSHVINIESEYKVKDRITDEELEPFLISVRDDESDSDDDELFEGIEFLDSDFDSE